MKTHPVSRRSFLRDAGIVAAAILTPPGSPLFSVWGKPVPFEPISIDLSKSENSALNTIGGARKIPNPRDKKRPIIVTRVSENDVAAFSSKCTHFGCEVALPAKAAIACPCHGATFDLKGKVTGGPARKDLQPFVATLTGSLITITDSGQP